MKNSFFLNPIYFFLIALLLVGILVGVLGWYYSIQFSDILIEAFGLLFDLLIFGVLWSIYDAITRRRGEVKKYFEEIEDFRKWKSEEASFRIAGIVKRLNKRMIREIDLSKCFLVNADLRYVKLSNSTLEGADLRGTDLRYSELQNINLIGIKVDASTKLHGANIIGCRADEKQKQTLLKIGASVKNINFI